MAEKIKSMIVCGQQGVSSALADEIGTFSAVRTLADPSEAYTGVREWQPGLLFIDTEADRNSSLNLARRALRARPDTSVFLVAREKNPDLILEGLRLGVADYLVFPNGKNSLLPAVRRVLASSGRGETQADVIALFSLRGGLGNTGVAVNLADQIRQISSGDRVLLADLNLYMGNVPVCLNFPCPYTPFDLIRDLDRMDENLLFSALAKHPRGFYVLAAPDGVSDADQVSREHMARMLTVLKAHFDYIVLDLPHDLSDRTLAALEAADRILMITRQEFPVIKSVQQVLDFLQELNYGEDKVKILLNGYDKSSELGPEDLEVVFRQPVFATVAEDRRTLTKAASKGQTVAEAYPGTRLSKSLEQLARQVIGMPPEKKNGSWFGRLFS